MITSLGLLIYVLFSDVNPSIDYIHCYTTYDTFQYPDSISFELTTRHPRVYSSKIKTLLGVDDDSRLDYNEQLHNNFPTGHFLLPVVPPASN